MSKFVSKKDSKKSVASKANADGASKSASSKSAVFAFGKINYILLIAGVVVLLVGYICLSGGGSDDPTKFNPALFDTRRLVVAPLLIVAGLVVEIFAIMLRPKDEKHIAEEYPESAK